MHKPASACIVERLLQLREDLSHYEQTTHGVLFSSPTALGHAFHHCFVDPNPYTISSLSQHIALFLKELREFKPGQPPCQNPNTPPTTTKPSTQT